MNKSKYSRFRIIMSAFFSGVFTLMGIAAVAAAIFVCVHFPNQKPILLSTPETAKSNLVAAMDAVCAGDYVQSGQYMLGISDFGLDRQPKDMVGALIWDEFLGSMDYQLVGDLYTTDAGLAQNISFTCLDVDSVVSNLRERSQALLAERVENAASVSDIYDENNEYREDVVEEVLHTATRDAIREDARLMTVELVLNLKYQDGKWWIVTDSALLDAIFGGILF